MKPLFALFAAPFTLAAAAIVSVLGILSLFWQGGAVAHVASEPLPLAAYVATLIALVVGTSIHEFGHAAALVSHGGRPSRIGAMIFYLMPALFCDVSDGWRLPRRAQRVQVALAGPAVQTFLAGAAALAALATPDSSWRLTLLLFSLSSYISGVLNLLPFVKLDGYLALMALLDIPFLRTKAMADARSAAAALLFGSRRTISLPGHRWAPWYGIACTLFPLCLIGQACALWLGTLQGLGIAGLVIAAALVLFALYLLWRRLRALVREAREAGARTGRMILVGAALLTAAVATLFLPVEHTVRGAYISDAQGTRLVFPDERAAQAVREGQAVTMQSNGLVLQRDLGQATVAGEHRPDTARLSAFMPLELTSDLEFPATAFPLSAAPAVPGDGPATVHLGSMPLGEHLYLTYLAPFTNH